MDIYSYLKKDHEKVSRIFEDIIEADSVVKRNSLFEKLKTELTLHADGEHVTFYKSLKKQPDTKDLALHADQEHAEVKEYLATLSKNSKNEKQWLVLLGELKHAVEHHVEEEETEIFDEAKKVLDKETATELAKEMEAFKKEKAS